MNNNDRLHKGVEEIKQIHLTKAEKEKMLEYVFTGKKASAPATVSDFIKRHHFLFSGTLASVLILFTTTFAAERSLPGDALYPIKIGFTEQLQGAFIFTTEDELRWEAQKVDNRLTEAEKLVKMGKFNAGAESELNTQIENRLQKVNRIETKISTEKKTNDPHKEKLLQEAAQTRRTIENKIFDANRVLREKIRTPVVFPATTTIRTSATTSRRELDRPKITTKSTTTPQIRATTSSSAQFFRAIAVPTSTVASTTIKNEDRPREMRLHIESTTESKDNNRTRIELPIKQNDADNRKIRVF